MSIQEANFWYSWFVGLDEDVVTLYDFVDVCEHYFPDEAVFDASPDDEYVEDHPPSELSEEMYQLLDMNKNGDISLNYARNRSTVDHVNNGTFT